MAEVTQLKLKIECEPSLKNLDDYPVYFYYYDQDPSNYVFKVFHMKFSPFNINKGVTYKDLAPNEYNNQWTNKEEWIENLQNFVNCIRGDTYGVNDGEIPSISYDPHYDTFHWLHQGNFEIRLNVDSNLRNQYAWEFQKLLQNINARIHKSEINDHVKNHINTVD